MVTKYSALDTMWCILSSYYCYTILYCLIIYWSDTLAKFSSFLMGELWTQLLLVRTDLVSVVVNSTSLWSLIFPIVLFQIYPLLPPDPSPPPSFLYKHSLHPSPSLERHPLLELFALIISLVITLFHAYLTSLFVHPPLRLSSHCRCTNCNAVTPPLDLIVIIYL